LLRAKQLKIWSGNSANVQLKKIPFKQIENQITDIYLEIKSYDLLCDTVYNIIIPCGALLVVAQFALCAFYYIFAHMYMSEKNALKKSAERFVWKNQNGVAM
jgi:hypothetical protein